MSRFAIPPKEEIIEDSEPEREEKRQKDKAKRRGSTTQARPKQCAPIILASPQLHMSLQKQEVIVISDDSDVLLDSHIPTSLANPPCVVSHSALGVDDGFGTEYLEYKHNESPQNALGNNLGRGPSTAHQPLAARREEKITLHNNQSPVTIDSVSDVSGHESTDEEPSKLPNFARYAYATSRASSVSAKSRSSVPPAAAQRAVPKYGSTKGLGTTVHCLQSFSDRELSRLLKCVSCELSWTSRKTVAQKVKHIQTCSKKNKLNDETVSVLIRTELARCQPEGSKGVSGPEAAVEAAPRTLLEGAVVDDVPKKKGRRPKVVETVKELADTRQNILERARLLLQSKSSATAAVKSHVPPGSEADSPSSPPSTQPFGQSALALQFRSRAPPEPTQQPIYVPDPSEVQRHHAPRSPASPPRTQPFGESNLAKQFQVKTSYLDLDTSPMHIPSPLAQRNQTSDGLQLSPTPRPANLPEDFDFFSRQMQSEEGDVYRNPIPAHLFSIPGPSRQNRESGTDLHRSRVSPPLENVPRGSLRRGSGSPITSKTASDWNVELEQTPRFDDEEEEEEQYRHSDWERGDAMLHYEPSEFYLPRNSTSRAAFFPASTSGVIIHAIPPTVRGKGKEVTRKKPARKPRESLSEPSPDTDEAPPPRPQSKKTRKPRSKEAGDVPLKKRTANMTDDKLFTELRTCILGDKELYLRILRYEPTHFDIFLKIAMDLGVSSKGLKLRVRDFLDKEAIHFYGLDMSKGRTKKRR